MTDGTEGSKNHRKANIFQFLQLHSFSASKISTKVSNPVTLLPKGREVMIPHPETKLEFLWFLLSPEELQLS